MSTKAVACVVVSAWIASVASGLNAASAQTRGERTPHESEVSVPGAALYVREIGRGRAIIVLHGGPDFDHSYLLPELDRLSDSYHLIYYDQRGRGQSARNVRPEDVTLASEMDDLDSLREHFHLGSVILLGHSWGTVLALEYAVRHPDHVSRLILMNPAPASAADLALFRQAYAQELGPDLTRQRQIVAGAAYKEGDPEAVTARYRLHFKPALVRPEDYEKLMERMQASFRRQGKDGIVEARAVEDRLMLDTWQRPGYDLLPELRTLKIRTLVLTGDHDFIPVTIAANIAAAMPNSKLITLEDCGHFAYLECPTDVHAHIDAFLEKTH